MSQRGRYIIIGVVLGLIALGLIVRLVDPQRSERTACRRDFARTVGHDVNDSAFWRHLQECARKGQLPPGQNDPAFYE